MKDWTGNKKSTFATLGASSHSASDREMHDYYATEPSTIDDLFAVHKFSDTIWESACGEGHLSKRMEEYGKSVFSTDLIDRGFGTGGVNFLQLSDEWEGDIITNPPYKYAKEFVEKSLELINDGAQVAMFLKLTFLEGQKRRKLFDLYPPQFIFERKITENIGFVSNLNGKSFASNSFRNTLNELMYFQRERNVLLTVIFQILEVAQRVTHGLFGKKVIKTNRLYGGYRRTHGRS